MNRTLAGLALVVSIFAVMLASRTQTFTHVSLDGRAIRMFVAGTGDATVVFESGLGAPLESWSTVQPAVARFARTVSYDRAGFGLSDEGPLPRDGHRIATELHRALRLANVPPPYVLVGHSFGGLHIRIFAGLYPGDVAGMVLVDPTQDGDDLEPSSEVAELAAIAATLAQARASAIPRGIPVTLIDARGPADVPFATRAFRLARAKARAALPAESLAYKQWVEGIPRGRLVVTDDSGHNVPHEQPALVVEVIRDVIQARRD